jgi:ABC-type Mn2+/Zn2+ transport system ATPase subunit
LVAVDLSPRQQSQHGGAAPAALRIEHVSVRLGERLALRDIDFEVGQGACVGLIGHNGSGKSTLIRAALGIVSPASGSILVHGRPIAAARDLVAYLPQRQHLDLELPLRARDVVMMGRLRHAGWFRAPSREDKDVVDWALEQVHLGERRNSAIGEMSFGQQQRVFFARALAQQGRLIFLDEPMNGVDPGTQELFVELLAHFHAGGQTIVMATHDLNQAACICDNLCVLNQDLVAYGPVGVTLTDEVLRAAYGGHIHFVQAPAGEGHAQVLEDIHHHETDVEASPSARRA